MRTEYDVPAAVPDEPKPRERKSKRQKRVELRRKIADRKCRLCLHPFGDHEPLSGAERMMALWCHSCLDKCT